MEVATNRKNGTLKKKNEKSRNNNIESKKNDCFGFVKAKIIKNYSISC